MVKNMFTQNMKIESKKKLINEVGYKRKTKQNRKKLWSALLCRIEWDAHRTEKIQKSKYT